MIFKYVHATCAIYMSRDLFGVVLDTSASAADVAIGQEADQPRLPALDGVETSTASGGRGHRQGTLRSLTWSRPDMQPPPNPTMVHNKPYHDPPPPNHDPQPALP